jgi:hypothetical protein
MLVYYLVKAHHGLENLRRRRLKISRIMDLNDPFEFLGADLSDRAFRGALKRTKQRLSEGHGLLCFSKSWRNPVLWGHYADHHRGLCLGFEVPRAFLTRVRYVDERFHAPPKPDLEFVRDLLFTKFSHWRYEQEYRTYVTLDSKVDGHYFQEFSTSLALKRVIVGDQSTVTRAQVLEALGDLAPVVGMFKARAAFRTFEVVRNRKESMWA